ncbi:hypothetical protein [uncultured Gammaproteobacteria bacterium]|jgi:hypothetical protein|nr:hypothetical protein [uncultured Gammaproteobacteria bacterium]CAC9655868.1 hypothetical protein [uncultured Gammaproteobacteria bacterium]CAC9657461.1 hypothetical protein [uncultured Gammaproteobacteria bacterium]
MIRSDKKFILLSALIFLAFFVLFLFFGRKGEIFFYFLTVFSIMQILAFFFKKPVILGVLWLESSLENNFFRLLSLMIHFILLLFLGDKLW